MSVYTIVLELKVSIESEEVYKDFSKVHIDDLLGDILRLEEWDYHQKECVRADSSIVGVVILAYLEILLQHKDERLNNFILCEEFLN